MDQENEYKAILTEWAYDCYKEGILDPLVEGDNEALKDKENLEKLVKIAIWCVQEDPYLRPTMRNVIHMLEGRGVSEGSRASEFSETALLEGTVEVQVPPYTLHQLVLNIL
ncbi:somatic embryogenesis receptor-like kinase, putative [Medicago truncatula]|uniref:Somatic embryogenesis receptor-like kinase, putative n=1 Tax=Medicago truncatula TaxID=3880 RepID=G7LEB7_MEDTR|nr:somatic embryogenesis receptor-like kinase, putative [Medicago truncatula]